MKKIVIMMVLCLLCMGIAVAEEHAKGTAGVDNGESDSMAQNGAQKDTGAMGSETPQKQMKTAKPETTAKDAMEDSNKTDKPETAGKPEEKGKPENETGKPEVIGQEKAEQMKEKVKGLENALIMVQNENAKQRLEQNMERFQERYQERMQNMENVEVEEVDEETGAVTVKAEEPVKWFGFIKGKATKRFEIDAKGNVNEKAPWYSFLYSES